jgi:hypothetical protein
MKYLLSFIVLAVITVLFTGCPGNSSYKYHDAYFPEKPMNITEVNSEYDDYNSILPETHFGKRLVFSSNRKFDPEDYDIYDGNFYVVWDWETGNLTFENNYHYGYYDYVRNLVRKIENTGNQFAPYSVSDELFVDNKQNTICYLLYSTNANRNGYRSEFFYYLTPNDGATGITEGPFVIPFLGDEKQQYVSFYGDDVVMINNWNIKVDDFTEMYFDQTVNGKSEIYRINIPDTLDFFHFLINDYNYEKVKVEDLCSAEDDRCPFVNGDLMVFASDRPGGYGGYDLYYSRYENGEWQKPVNFGDQINSEYNEFRPVTVHASEFMNDLMIFSSDRPGGLGGFDLYYVGIQKIVKNEW